MFTLEFFSFIPMFLTGEKITENFDGSPKTELQTPELQIPEQDLGQIDPCDIAHEYADLQHWANGNCD